MILNHGQWNGRPVLDKDLLAECFKGSEANRGYGITFWLPMNGGIDSEGRSGDQRAARLKAIHASGPIIKAAGAGGQKLYVIPSRNLVIVRQAARWALTGSGFDDAGFLAPILLRQAD